MPTIPGTLGLIGLKIIIGIIITLIFSIIIITIISIFYKKINNHEIDDFKFNKNFSKILYISYLLLFIIIIISFFSPKGTEYTYRNRIGLINVTEKNKIYNKPGPIHSFFNPQAKTTISKTQINKIKKYNLVQGNNKYKKQKQKIISQAKHRAKYKRKYYNYSN